MRPVRLIVKLRHLRQVASKRTIPVRSSVGKVDSNGKIAILFL
jgi:hypothetical protein